MDNVCGLTPCGAGFSLRGTSSVETGAQAEARPHENPLMSRRSILIVAAGPLQIPVFEEARRQRLRIVAIEANPAAPRLKLCDSAHVVALDNYEAIRKVAEQERVTAVTSLCTDFAVRAVAYVA